MSEWIDGVLSPVIASGSSSSLFMSRLCAPTMACKIAVMSCCRLHTRRASTNAMSIFRRSSECTGVLDACTSACRNSLPFFTWSNYAMYTHLYSSGNTAGKYIVSMVQKPDLYSNVGAHTTKFCRTSKIATPRHVQLRELQRSYPPDLMNFPFPPLLLFMHRSHATHRFVMAASERIGQDVYHVIEKPCRSVTRSFQPGP